MDNAWLRADGAPLVKYPRTPHIADSRLQRGDEDMAGEPFSALTKAGGEVFYEEKVDGANCAFRFDGAGNPMAQSRGHYLDLSDRNLWRERQFTHFKDWLLANADTFLERFEDRYVVFGEWMGVTHSVFYDRLPDFFLEFDIYDLKVDCFLSTERRRALLGGLPITSVPVLYRGEQRGLQHLKSLMAKPVFRSPDQAEWRANLQRACRLLEDDFEARLKKMDTSDLAEGFYIKAEKDGRVVGRWKWVQPGFVQTILSADEHWHSRFMVPNLLDGQHPILPPMFARTPEPLRAYDPDAPWQWGPWIQDCAGGPPAPSR